MIDARAEVVSEKPAFRKPFRKRRCLVLTDGFYEWQKTDKGKQPFYTHMEDGPPSPLLGCGRSGMETEKRSAPAPPTPMIATSLSLQYTTGCP